MGGKTHHLKEKKNNNSLRENAVLPNHTKLTAIYILYQGGKKKERERVEQPTFNFLKKSWYVLIIKWKLKKKNKTKLVWDLTKDTIFCHYKQRKGILEFTERVFQIWYSHFHIKGHKESHHSSIYQLLVLHKACKRTAAISFHITHMIVGIAYPFMNLYGEQRGRVAWV